MEVDIELLTKLNAAVAAANEAKKTAETASAELVSRSKQLGLLLLDAKKLHKGKDFEAFLGRVEGGLSLSWAYDCMRLAGGRITDEKLKEDARRRKQKSRENKKKLPKPTQRPIPKPVRDSVTNPDVTESAKTEKHEAETAATMSENASANFTYACHHWLPKMTEADRQKALQLVSDIVSPKAEAA